MIVRNRSNGRTIATRVELAESAVTRSKGLLGRDRLDPEEGIWIVPCRMIHMFFMRFAIDLVFLDRQLKVVRLIEGIKPWRLSPWVWKAHSVIELAAGTVKGKVEVGDILEIS